MNTAATSSPARTTPQDGRTITSGSRLWSTSIRNRAVPAAARYNQSGKIAVNPTVQAIRANKTPTTASTNGYRKEIRDWQLEHRPRRTSQDATGMFSRALI